MTVRSRHTGYTSDDVETLVTDNLGLVKRVAHHLAARLPGHIQLDDLVQSGFIGLLEAAQRYQASTGVAFQAYAVNRIRGAMLDELRKGDWMPRSVHRRAREVAMAIRTIEARVGREANRQEIAEALGLTGGEYDELLMDLSNQNLLSLDELTGYEENVSQPLDSSSLGPLGEAEKEQMVERVTVALDRLPERDKLVLSLYYDEELCLREIGAILGITVSRVSQLLTQARLKLGLQAQEAPVSTESEDRRKCS